METLARKALPQWGIDSQATVDLIKFRENAVFRITVPDGRRYALRVHRADYHGERALHSELQWMIALRELGIPTPEVVPTVNGALYVRVVGRESQTINQCDLLSWIDGEPLGSAEVREYSENDVIRLTYLAVGRLAGKIHAKSALYEPPKDFFRQSWDEHGFFGRQALWGDYADLEKLTQAHRILFARGVDFALEKLALFGKQGDRYGLVHSDFVPDNLISRNGEVVIIDFDDCGYGWHLWEIATAVFWHIGESSYEPALRSMVEGYREEHPLPESHLAMLPVFLYIRALVYLGWMHTRRDTETAVQLTDHTISVALDLCEAMMHGAS